jgi:3',5'-cyclic AMP phosphodiesterase CpdA
MNSVGEVVRQFHRWGRGILILTVLLTTLCPAAAEDTPEAGPLRVGILADLHAHDTENPMDGWILTNWAERLGACVDAMNAWPADLLIELGDFINGRFVIGGEIGPAHRIAAILEAAEAVYARFDGPRYYVLGNHDLGDLSKEEFLARVGAERTTLSFDVGAYHVVILDAQYSEDGQDRSHEFWYMPGYVPPRVLDWLGQDLAATDRPTIVCVHQRLDLEHDLRHGGPEIVNHGEVRAVLHDDGDVIAVFQGHDHQGGYSLIDGIHYVTLCALLERIGGSPLTWAYVTLDPISRTIEIDGEGEQEDLLLDY